MLRSILISGLLAGFAAGMAAGLANLLAVHAGFLHYGSTLAQSFYGAMLAFSMAAVTCLLVSGPATHHTGQAGLVFRWALSWRKDGWLAAGAAVLLLLCLALNLWVR